MGHKGMLKNNMDNRLRITCACILRPHADRCEILSEVELPLSDQGLNSQRTPEPIVAGAAVARGRVYFVSSDTLYAIGPKQTQAAAWEPVAPVLEPGDGPATWVQVTPTELVLKAGESVQLHARLFDAKGRFLRGRQSRLVAPGTDRNGDGW